MKGSMKKVFNLAYILFITFIFTLFFILIKFNLINSANVFSLTYLFVFLFVIVISAILTNILLDYIINPLKKLEKNINSVTSR